MTLKQFIKRYRAEIDRIIELNCGPDFWSNDKERRLWVLNDEYLYRLAKSKGVDI